jgi:hypothetical protein
MHVFQRKHVKNIAVKYVIPILHDLLTFVSIYCGRDFNDAGIRSANKLRRIRNFSLNFVK